jgi:hypothetical protein
MDTFNNGMPKQYPIEYTCKAVECRVNVVNADALTLDEMRTLADREIRRQIAEKTRRSANKVKGESVKFFNLSQREKQTTPEAVPTFDVKAHMQPTERETAKKKNEENARLADLMRRFAAGEITQEEMLAEMNNQ